MENHEAVSANNMAQHYESGKAASDAGEVIKSGSANLREPPIMRKTAVRALVGKLFERIRGAAGPVVDTQSVLANEAESHSSNSQEKEAVAEDVGRATQSEVADVAPGGLCCPENKSSFDMPALFQIAREAGESVPFPILHDRGLMASMQLPSTSEADDDVEQSLERHDVEDDPVSAAVEICRPGKSNASTKRQTKQKLELSDVLAIWMQGVVAEIAEKNAHGGASAVLVRAGIASDHFHAIRDYLLSETELFPLFVPDSKKEYSGIREQLLSQIAGGKTVVLWATPAQKIPPVLRDVIDTELDLPDLSAGIIEKSYGVVLTDPVCIPEGDWTRDVLLPDIVSVSREYPCKIASALRQLVLGRRACTGLRNGSVVLDELHGLGDAKTWALNMIRDVKAMLRGELDADDIDSGALLDGPPGVGKTALVRAIAIESGIPVVATSAASWMSAGSLDDVLKAMTADFDQALSKSPSILFVDEIEAMGSRASIGQHSEWIRWTVNHLLALMDGFAKKRKIIVIGATNHAEILDDAIKRPGRLERTIVIKLPNIKDRALIFDVYLSKIQHTIQPNEIERIARASSGSSGADIEKYVREAKARARDHSRLPSADDLIEAIFGIPRNPNYAAMSKEERLNVAWRIGCRAVVAAKLGVGTVLRLNLLPRADGKVGGVSLERSEDVLKNGGDYKAEIAVEIAERVGEEFCYGTSNVTTASAGAVKKAGEIAQNMIISSRLADSGRLHLNDFIHAREISDEAERVIRAMRRRVRSVIAEHEEIVRLLVDKLIESGDMGGEQFNAILCESVSRASSTSIAVEQKIIPFVR